MTIGEATDTQTVLRSSSSPACTTERPPCGPRPAWPAGPARSSAPASATYSVWDGTNKQREANERIITACTDSGGTWTYLGGTSGGKTCVYLKEVSDA